MKNDKYLSTGALNPAWVYEREEEEFGESLEELGHSFFELIKAEEQLKRDIDIESSERQLNSVMEMAKKMKEEGIEVNINININSDIKK